MQPARGTAARMVKMELIARLASHHGNKYLVDRYDRIKWADVRHRVMAVHTEIPRGFQWQQVPELARFVFTEAEQMQFDALVESGEYDPLTGLAHTCCRLTFIGHPAGWIDETGKNATLMDALRSVFVSKRNKERETARQVHKGIKYDGALKTFTDQKIGFSGIDSMYESANLTWPEVDTSTEIETALSVIVSNPNEYLIDLLVRLRQHGETPDIVTAIRHARRKLKQTPLVLSFNRFVEENNIRPHVPYVYAAVAESSCTLMELALLNFHGDHSTTTIRFGFSSSTEEKSDTRIYTHASNYPTGVTILYVCDFPLAAFIEKEVLAWLSSVCVSKYNSWFVLEDADAANLSSIVQTSRTRLRKLLTPYV